MIRQFASLAINSLPSNVQDTVKRYWVAGERTFQRPQLQMKCRLDEKWEENLSLPALTDGYQLHAYNKDYDARWRELLDQSGEFGAMDETTFQSEILDHLVPDGAMFVTRGEKLVACAAVCALPSGLPAATLSYVVVRPEHRGHKLGKIASASVMQHARQQGFDEIILHTDDERLPAIITYAQLGFSPVSQASPGARARWQRIARTLNHNKQQVEPPRISPIGSRS